MGRRMTPKKSKETRRQTRRPVQQDELIADAEWHFGKLSNERLIPCFLWEFYREALLKDSILANRVQKIRERFSACGRFLEPVGVRKLRRYWEFYSLCMLPMDVWPSQPFLHQSDEFLSEWKSHYTAVFGEDIEEFHDKLEEQGFPGIRDFQQPLGKFLDRADELVREFSDPRAGVFSGWVKWPLEVIRADQFTEVVRRQDEDERSVFMQLTRTQPATSKPARGGGKKFNVVVAFSLDFEQSNSVLKLQFDTWLRKVRALGLVPAAPESRGISRNPHSLRIDTSNAEKNLACLGKLRLTEVFDSQAKAIRYARRSGLGVSGCDPSNFSKAVGEVVKCITKIRLVIRRVIKDSSAKE